MVGGDGNDPALTLRKGRPTPGDGLGELTMVDLIRPTKNDRTN
jgi:hypothetical protein